MVGLLLVGWKYLDWESINIELSSVEEGTMVVDPSSAVTMKLASSQVFTSYIETSTDPVPVQMDWMIAKGDLTPAQLEDYSEVSSETVEIDPDLEPQEFQELKAEEAVGVTLAGCKNTDTCTVRSGSKAGQFTLIAKNRQGQVVVEVTVEEELPENPYKEEFPEWAEEAVYTLYNSGVMQGYADGSFGKEDPITRAQMVTLLYKLAQGYGVDVEGLTTGMKCDIYSDVKADHFAYKPVCWAHYADWIEEIEKPEGKLNPEQPLLRHEVASIVFHALGDKAYENMVARYLSGRWYTDLLTTESMIEDAKRHLDDFEDLTENTPNIDGVAFVVDMDIMSGTWNADLRKKSFYPMKTITRLEVAKVIDNVMYWLK